MRYKFPELVGLHPFQRPQPVVGLPVLEVTGRCKIAVGAGTLLRPPPAGVCIDVPLPQLTGDLVQQLLHILPQPPQLRRRSHAAADAAVLAHLNGQEARRLQRTVLHGPQHLRIPQHHAVPPQLPIHGLAEGLR